MAVRRQVGKEHNNIIMGFRWWCVCDGGGGSMFLVKLASATHVGVLL